MHLVPIDTPHLRKDTTVGTRIFAGDIMIFGDTGWRDVTQLYLNSAAITGNALDLTGGGAIHLKRINNTMLLKMVGPIKSNRNWTNLIPTQFGLRTSVRQDAPLSLPTAQAKLSCSYSWIGIRDVPVGVVVAAGEVAVGEIFIDQPWIANNPGTPI